MKAEITKVKSVQSSTEYCGIIFVLAEQFPEGQVFNCPTLWSLPSTNSWLLPRDFGVTLGRRVNCRKAFDNPFGQYINLSSIYLIMHLNAYSSKFE